jgi:hypothetical protein
MNMTFQGAFNGGTPGYLTLKGSSYIGNNQWLYSPSMGINDKYIHEIRVDPDYVYSYRLSQSWTDITKSKFVPR